MTFTEVLRTSGVSEGGISYYCMTTNDIKNGSYFPQVSATINAYFNPYLKFGNLETQVESVTNIKTIGTDNNWSGTVKRIKSHHALNDTITTFYDFDNTGIDLTDGKFNWRKESKLHCYPYTLLSYEDGLSEPLTLYPQYLEHENKLMVRSALNQQGYYLLYVANYRNDKTGLTYGVTSQSPAIPTVTNAYSDYMTTNREKLLADKLLNAGNILVGAGSLAIGNTAGIGQALGGINELAQSYLNERAIKGQANTVNVTNSNYAFMLQQNIYGHIYKYQYPEQIMARIGAYFHQYGYAMNQLMQPPLRSRKNFNYIKTNNVNLVSDGTIPHEYLLQLETIYNNGVTIWHADRTVSIRNYSYDNVEV